MDPNDPDIGGGLAAEDVRDRMLLAQALEGQVAANRSRAMVLEAMHDFHARRVHEAEKGHSEGPAFFGLTALQATKVEFGPLLGMGDQYIEANLRLADALTTYFPRLWGQCLQGRMDVGRAGVAVSYLWRLVNEEDKLAYARSVEDFLGSQDEPGAGLHPVRYHNLQQACWRRARRFEQITKEQSFAEAFAKRRVRLRSNDDGMASMVCTTRVDKGLAADYRLTLIAKKRAEVEGEDRTIEQLRVDTMIDLILGRVTVAAGDGDLEEGETAEGVPVDDPLEWHDIGKFARPIVNVTVPITNLMGLSGVPATLAGGTVVPPELADMIAFEPDSVWYRMLTDPDGGFRELSTDSYTPTEAQWRWDVAENPECIWPTCRRPATVTEIDHRVPFPFGRTSTRNLQPLCEHHHKVKHSHGFTVRREEDGSYTWISRFGVVSKKPAPLYPLAEWPDAA